MRKYKKEWHRAEERLAASGGRRVAAVCGGRCAAGGGRRVAGGGWRVAGGGWRAAGGGRRAANSVRYVL